MASAGINPEGGRTKNYTVKVRKRKDGPISKKANTASEDERESESPNQRVRRPRRRLRFRESPKSKKTRPAPEKSFYEVDRLTPIQQQYPRGPEVRTRLRHTGYPELTENRFRQWAASDSEAEIVSQRAHIGMPTSSYSDVESDESAVRSRELLKIDDVQTAEVRPEVERPEEALPTEELELSDSHTIEDESDFEIVHDGTKDVSYYVKPSMIAWQERAWKVQSMPQPDCERPETPHETPVVEQQSSEMDSLNDESVASLLPELPEPPCLTTSRPTHGTAEVQILPGKKFYHKATSEGSFDVHPFPRNEAQTHFDPIRRFLSTEGLNSPLIDIQVRINGQDFQTHRLLLVTYSRYFRELNDEGRLKPHCIVVMDFISTSGFARVLHWINTANLELSMDNVEEVLAVAKVLGIVQIVDKCQLYVKTMSEWKNEDFSVTQCALDKNYTAVGSSFPEIVQNKFYLDYSVDQLCSLLSRDDLPIKSETEVYVAACNWLLYAYESRQEYEYQIMQCVRFKLMTPFELRDLLLQSPNPLALKGHVAFMFCHALLYQLLKALGQPDQRLGPAPSPRTFLDCGAPVVGHSAKDENIIRGPKKTDPEIVDWGVHARPAGATSLPENQDRLESTGKKLGKPVKGNRRASRTARKRKLSRGSAAIRIQANYRGYLVRTKTSQRDGAALTIQRNFRGYLVRKELLEHERAASTIQRGYRKYVDHMKYNFLTAAASYSPARRSTKSERNRDPDTGSSRPYFKLPSDPAFVCFGGITSAPDADLSEIASRIYAFDIESDEWKICGALPEPRADAAVCLLGNSAILTGGYNPGDPLHSSCKTAWKLDIVTGNWEVLPYMPTARRLHGQVIANGRIYVVGGCGDGCLPVGSMECYNPVTKEWMEVEPLHVPRFAAAVVCHCGKIWVCGGVTHIGEGKTRKITDQVDVYDPNKKKWSREKSLPSPRAFCDLVSVDNSMLLVVGGVEAGSHSGEVYVTSTILTFDFEDGKWRYLMNLPGNRYKAKVVSRDPYWFVVGGESSISGPSLSTVECFDTHDQRWVAIPHLPVSLQGTCCIAVE